jgi:hypothetical protein
MVELILSSNGRYMFIRGRAGKSKVEGDSVHTIISNVTALAAELSSNKTGFDVSNQGLDDTPESKLMDGLFSMNTKNQMVYIADASGDINARKMPVIQAWKLELQKPHHGGAVWNAKTTSRRHGGSNVHVGPRGGRFTITRGHKVYK